MNFLLASVLNGFADGHYPLWFVLTGLFLLGTVFGSFLNVLIHRFPRHDTLREQLRCIWGRSNCPRCKTEILARDNIPIFGWLMLGGKCRSCKLRIPKQYPLIELLNGLLFVLVYLFELPDGLATGWRDSCVVEPDFGPNAVTRWGLGPDAPGMSASFEAWSAPVWLHVRYAFHMLMIQSLLVATMIDFKKRIIPSAVTDPLIVVGVIANTIFGQAFMVVLWFAPQQQFLMSVMPDWLQWMDVGFNAPDGTKSALAFAHEHPHLHGFLFSVVGALVGAGIVGAVRVIGTWALRKEAMGTGDIALMAMIGAFLGWQPVIIIFFLAVICALGGVLVRLIFTRESELAYGPYISLGAVLLVLFWDRIWPYWRGYFEFGVGIFIVGAFMGFMMFALLLMLQAGKRMLGIPLYEDDGFEDWPPADQLQYLAGENVDQQQGQWRRSQWEGSLSGRGMNQIEVWRNGR